MNRVKLKEAEEKFIIRFPGGFSNPQMLELAKKHKVGKMKNNQKSDIRKKLNFMGLSGLHRTVKISSIEFPSRGSRVRIPSPAPVNSSLPAFCRKAF
jgi:hypothetical protein